MELDVFTILGFLATSLFSAFLAVFVIGWLGRPKPIEMRSGLAGDAKATKFIFEGTSLVDATPAALLFVGAPVDRNAVLSHLRDKLKARFDKVGTKLDQLINEGVEFNLRAADGSILTGRLTQTGFALSLGLVEIDAPVQTIEQQAIGLQFAELLFLREICELSPVLVWQQDTDGVVHWTNRAYREVATELMPDSVEEISTFQTVFDGVDGTSTPKGGRNSLEIPGTTKPQWFEVSTHSQHDGKMICFAFRADPVVQAEEALRNFVQTLTKTFAHLPIGLAIFDRNRQLALFNPALADLTTLEPTWLTARPTLTTFLDRLRENRHIPEPKDYKSWRDRIAALERAAEDGTYEENWPLPTGQTYRVTGRPHPEGAVAFLFEDITSSISLQREFRSELELAQSVLDSQDMAVAVFAAHGDLVMSNDGFARLWEIDPREMLARLGVAEAVSIWRDKCEPSPVWVDFLTYAAKPTERVQWRGQIKLNSGQTLQVEVKPLSHGAFLCEFTATGPVFSRERQKTLAQA